LVGFPRFVNGCLRFVFGVVNASVLDRFLAGVVFAPFLNGGSSSIRENAYSQYRE
jgi:hypothetical protein